MKDENNVKQIENLQIAKAVVLSDLQPEIKKGNNLLEGNYSIISDLKLNLEAIIGTAELTVKDLFELKSGSIVELNQSIEGFLTFRLNGKPIAFGSLVVVGDNFGVKITEIIAAEAKVA